MQILKCVYPQAVDLIGIEKPVNKERRFKIYTFLSVK